MSFNFEARGVSAPMSNMDSNSYGAHLLVDFTSIDAADKLLGECEAFIDHSQEDIGALPENIPFPILSRVSQGVKSWRTKRRDTKLVQDLENLLPRIVQNEKSLRNIMGEVVEKKAALRLQARYLEVRLESCIEHNKDLLSQTNEPLDSLRAEVNVLSEKSAVIKAMMTFNKEVLRIRNVEKISKGQSFVRWGQSAKPQKASVTEADLAKDADHPVLEAHLVALRELREKFMACLAAVLESRGAEIANLDNCERSLQAISEMLKRGGAVVRSATEGGADGGGAEPITFDHSRCTDCSYGYSITCDCTNHMAALQQQGADANQRLQQLVEMREKLTEIAEMYSLSHGVDSSNHGSNSGKNRINADSPNSSSKISKESGGGSSDLPRNGSFSSYSNKPNDQQHTRSEGCNGDSCSLSDTANGSAVSSSPSGTKKGIAETDCSDDNDNDDINNTATATTATTDMPPIEGDEDAIAGEALFN